MTICVKKNSDFLEAFIYFYFSQIMEVRIKSEALKKYINVYLYWSHRVIMNSGGISI